MVIHFTKYIIVFIGEVTATICGAVGAVTLWLELSPDVTVAYLQTHRAAVALRTISKNFT